MCCGSTCTHDYPSGTPVSLNAAAAGGSRFGNWSGGCSGSGACDVTMSQDRTVTATFVAQHQLTVSTTGSGTVTSSPAGISCPADCDQLYDQGNTVTLTPTPAAGWSFAGWGGACGGTGGCVVTMNTAQSVAATFTQNPPAAEPPPPSGPGSTPITSPPLTPPTHSSPVAPTFTLTLGRLRPADAARRSLPLSARCRAACRLLGRAYLDGTTARRLGLVRTSRTLMVGSGSGVRTTAGALRLVIGLNVRTRRAIRRAARVAFVLRVRGLDSTGKASRTRYFRVTLRRSGRSPLLVPLAAAPSGVP